MKNPMTPAGIEPETFRSPKRVCALRFPSAVMVKVCTFCTLCDLCLLFSEVVTCLLCRILPELVLVFILGGVRILCCRFEHTSYWMAYLTHNKCTCHICVFSMVIKTVCCWRFLRCQCANTGWSQILGAFAKFRKEIVSFAVSMSARTSTWHDFSDWTDF